MTLTASSISTNNTLEQLRNQFNNLVTDVEGLETGTKAFSSITATTSSSTFINVLEDGNIVFEGATDDAFETTLTVADPTADRTITLPDSTGTVVVSGDGSFTVADGGTIGSTSSTDTLTLAASGIVTFKDDILIKDGGTIGNASVADVMTLASTGIVTFKDDILIKDGGTIGSASSTSAITIASTGIVTFVDDIIIKDAGTIGSASDVDAISIGADGDVTLTQDLELQHDGATISFGANDEIQLIHDHDVGLLLKRIGTADNTFPRFTLQAGDTDIAQDDVLGQIQWQAPDEGTGTDAILVAAKIDAISEGDFSSSSNATSLRFHTGSSAEATSKMRFTSTGRLGLAAANAGLTEGSFSAPDTSSGVGTPVVTEAPTFSETAEENNKQGAGSSGGSVAQPVKIYTTLQIDNERFQTVTQDALIQLQRQGKKVII